MTAFFKDLIRFAEAFDWSDRQSDESKRSLVRQVCMAQTRNAALETAEEHAPSNESNDVSPGLVEELTALRAIVEAAARSSGEEYFQAFVRNLARAVDAHYAFIAEFASAENNTKARTIAFWAKDRIADNFEWTLAGTPCEEVLMWSLCQRSSVRSTTEVPGRQGPD